VASTAAVMAEEITFMVPCSAVVAAVVPATAE
jgi:hypothetical protein